MTTIVKGKNTLVVPSSLQRKAGINPAIVRCSP
jgi:hypothetical protein